jgi:hypothetical protein
VDRGGGCFRPTGWLGGGALPEGARTPQPLHWRSFGDSLARNAEGGAKPWCQRRGNWASTQTFMPPAVGSRSAGRRTAGRHECLRVPGPGNPRGSLRSSPLGEHFEDVRHPDAHAADAGAATALRGAAGDAVSDVLLVHGDSAPGAGCGEFVDCVLVTMRCPAACRYHSLTRVSQ